jgi:hypothetical protein
VRCVTSREGPVANSFYPFNTAAVLTTAVLEDAPRPKFYYSRKSGPEKVWSTSAFVMLTRQPLAVSSRHHSAVVAEQWFGADMEVMLHRNLKRDDGRGMSQVRRPPRIVAVARCDAMRCDAMRCDAMRCDAMRCDAMRCDAMRCAWCRRVTTDRR